MRPPASSPTEVNSDQSADRGVLACTPDSHPVAARQSQALLYFQLLFAITSWSLLCILHWDNNGLWFPCDSAVHFSNGIFLSDYASDGFPPPATYAQGYLIRYPAFTPKKYPPGFYLLEATLFSILAPSPMAAKSLVLGFALLFTLYQVAWLRRFVDPAAGFFAAILPLIPSMVWYSHAILLNVPTSALQLGALYHCRCWLDEGGKRHVLLAGAFTLLALLFYQGAAVVPLIIAVWLYLSGRWREIIRHRRALLAAVPLLLLSASLVGLSLVASGQARWLYNSPYIRYWVTWMWYPSRLNEAFGPILPWGAALGAGVCILNRSRRRELMFSGSWILTTYLLHTYLFGKDIRYVLPLAAPLLSLTAVGFWSILEYASRVLAIRKVALTSSIIASALTAVQFRDARLIELPRVSGFTDVISAIQSAEPAGESSILAVTDPAIGQLLSCHLRLADPAFRLRLLPAPRLWWIAGFTSKVSDELPDTTDGKGIASSLSLSGCQWVVIQDDTESGANRSPAAEQRLNSILQAPPFELIGSFAVHGERATVLRVYRRSGKVGELTELARISKVRPADTGWLLRAPVSRRRE